MVILQQMSTVWPICIEHSLGRPPTNNKSCKQKLNLEFWSTNGIYVKSYWTTDILTPSTAEGSTLGSSYCPVELKFTVKKIRIKQQIVFINLFTNLFYYHLLKWCFIKIKIIIMMMMMFMFAVCYCWFKFRSLSC